MITTATHFAFAALALASPCVFSGCMTRQARIHRAGREDARYHRRWDASMN